MTLSAKQSLFLFNVARLIMWINEQPGMTATCGEFFRPQEMQDIYLKTGKSKAKHSRHQDRLAADLNLFINGVYVTDKESYKPVAEHWKQKPYKTKSMLCLIE